MDEHRTGDDLAILACALAGMAAVAGAAYLFRRSWMRPPYVIEEETAAILNSGKVKGLG
jgi:hypothetical protein